MTGVQNSILIQNVLANSVQVRGVQCDGYNKGCVITVTSGGQTATFENPGLPSRSHKEESTGR